MHRIKDIRHLALRCADCGHLNELTYDQGADGETLACAHCLARLGTVQEPRLPTRH